MTSLAPIVLFIYRRAAHAHRAIQALAACPESRDSDLVVFSDGARGESQNAEVEATRAVAHQARGFRTVRVVERDRNMGLSVSIISGINEVLSEADRAVILEDDIEVSPDFLSFMNTALDHYSSRPAVHSVSGFLYPVRLDPRFPYDTFLFPRFSCWGWATWRDRWRAIRWDKPERREFLRSAEFRRLWQASNDLPELMLDLIDGKNDSWAVQVNRWQIRSGAYCVHPVRSLARNTGLDGSGTHFRSRAKGSPGSAEGLGRQNSYRFADVYDDRFAEPVRRYFAHGPRRKLKNLLIYGRYF